MPLAVDSGMRFLRLDFDDGHGSVDLHPFLTVVAGLDADSRHRVLDALSRLASGQPGAVGGLVEDGGLLLEVAAEPITVDPDHSADHILDFDQPVASVETQAALSAALDQAHRRAQIDAVRVEEARNELRPGIAAALRELELELRRANVSDPSTDPLLLEVEATLDALRSVPSVVETTDPEIDELRRAWFDFEQRYSEVVDHLAGLERLEREAETNLDDARAELARAEAEAEPLLLGVDDEARLEELANRPAASGILSFRAKPPRTPEEDAELADLLDKIDQPTYSAYVMYRLRPTPRGDAAARLDSARSRVMLATEEAAAIRRDLASDPVRHEIGEIRRDVDAMARRLMGPVLPADLGASISQLVIAVENPDYAVAVAAAREVMFSNKIEVPTEIGVDLFADWLESWVRQRRAELTGWALEPEELAALQAEVDRTRQVLHRHEAALLRIDRLEESAAASLLDFRHCEAELDASRRGPVNGLADALVRLRARLDASRHDTVVTPLVITSQFDHLADVEIRDLLDVLIDTASSRQVVLVSDHPVARAWTSDAGLSRAILSRVSTTN